MTDIQPRDYLVGIICFTIVIVGGISIIDAFRTADSSFIDQDKYYMFNETFNIKNGVDTSVNNIRNSIITENLPAPIAFISTMFLTAFQALMGLFTSLNFMNAVFNGLYTVFGIPIWVSGLLISLVTIMIVFSIISAILQRDI